MHPFCFPSILSRHSIFPILPTENVVFYFWLKIMQVLRIFMRLLSCHTIYWLILYSQVKEANRTLYTHTKPNTLQFAVFCVYFSFLYLSHFGTCKHSRWYDFRSRIAMVIHVIYSSEKKIDVRLSVSVNAISLKECKHQTLQFNRV